MLHIMPSRTWKVLQLIFYYPHLLLGGLDAVFDGLTARSRLPPRSTATRAPAPTSPACVTDRWSDERTWRLTLKTVLQGIVPRVHGEYAGHVAEWDGFGAQAWHDELGRHGLAVHTVMRLPLYSGYGFGFNRLRLLGERWGLSSHNAFVVSEKTARPSAVQWFERGPRRLSPRDPS
jgi:hypothetical protein